MTGSRMPDAVDEDITCPLLQLTDELVNEVIPLSAGELARSIHTAIGRLLIQSVKHI